MGYDVSRKNEKEGGGGTAVMYFQQNPFTNFSLILLLPVFLFSCTKQDSEQPEKNKNSVEIQEKKKPSKSKKRGFRNIAFINDIDLYLNIYGIVTDSGGPTGQVAIDVFVDDTLYFQTENLDDGSYYLPPINPYAETKIYFHKKSHYIKYCELNPVDFEITGLSGKFPLEINATINAYSFPNFEAFNYMLENPAAVAAYDSLLDNYRWNLDALTDYKQKVNQILR